MPINDIRIDLPLIISSSGTLDQAEIKHNATDLRIDNDTGKILFGNKISTQLSIDPALKRIGFFTVTPSCPVELSTTGENAEICATRTDGAKSFLSGGATRGFFGTKSAHPVRIIVSDSYKAEFLETGDFRVPAGYSTLIGGTNNDLYIDDTGLIGPLPSSIDFKENIRPATGAPEIYNIKVKIADYKNGPKDVLTIIAEEAETDYPAIARHEFFENQDGQYKKIDRSKFRELDKVDIAPGQEKLVTVKKIKPGIEPEETEDFTVTLKRKAISVNKSDLIIPMLLEIQNLEKRVKDLEATVL